jgi:uncharacterized protein YcsI (UPF0317 family)
MADHEVSTMRHEAALPPAEARAMFRDGLVTPTAGWSRGWTQANLIALPRELAFDFLLFAQRNPKPCPVLDVIEAGATSGPLLAGDPRALGIEDLGRPDYGDPVDLREGEVPVFWGCGVTPQAAVVESKPDLAIAHAPGHMLITDARDGD